jgi:ADP-ribose pyrophosphatase
VAKSGVKNLNFVALFRCTEISMIKQQYGQNDFEITEREPCFEGFFKLDRFHFKHKRFDGSWSRSVGREIFIRGDATCVLPYDPVESTVVLVEQFRVGAVSLGPEPLETAEASPWLIELVAGINEAGENPEDVARREAVEEANLELGELMPICQYLASPGGSTENVHLYCASVDSREVGGVFGLAEEDEDIRAHVVSFNDAMLMVESGQINNAAAIIALQWLALNRERVDRAWLPQSK